MSKDYISSIAKNLNLDGFEKADILHAFGGHGDEKMTFKKKGGELKALLYAKLDALKEEKEMVLAKMKVLRSEFTEAKEGTREGNVDEIDAYGEYPLPVNTEKQLTDDEKKAYQMFRDYMYKCRMLHNDIKICETLIKHVQDDKDYTLNLRQLSSIEKADTDIEFFFKAESESDKKIAKVMREFKQGTLRSSSGDKVTSRDQAIAIAMSEAGLSKADMKPYLKKFYPHGIPTEQANKLMEERKGGHMTRTHGDILSKAYDAFAELGVDLEKGDEDDFDGGEDLGKDEALEKGQVKGHYRMVRGKKVYVKPYSDTRTKKEGDSRSELMDKKRAESDKAKKEVKNFSVGDSVKLKPEYHKVGSIRTGKIVKVYAEDGDVKVVDDSEKNNVVSYPASYFSKVSSKKEGGANLTQQHKDAIEALGDKDKKKIAGNTFLEKRGDGIAVKLYDTDVVTYQKDGSVKLQSGGYMTKTTKDRINSHFGGSVYQRQGKWYVDYKGNTYTYKDGITMHPNGNVTGQGG